MNCDDDKRAMERLIKISKANKQKYTEAERRFEKMISIASKKTGITFEREYPILKKIGTLPAVTGYIIDFYMPEIRQSFEIDGVYHNNQDNIPYDLKRTRYLANIGIREYRYKNDYILHINRDWMVENLTGIITRRAENINYSPEGTGDNIQHDETIEEFLQRGGRIKAVQPSIFRMSNIFC